MISTVKLSRYLGRFSKSVGALSHVGKSVMAISLQVEICDYLYGDVELSTVCGGILLAVC